MNNVCTIIVFIIICVLAFLAVFITKKTKQITQFAGSEKHSRDRNRILRSENIIVDTLNLVHALNEGETSINIQDIIAVIDETASVIRQRYPGRIMYVTKDRETRQDKAEAVQIRALYQAAARRNMVYISVVERLPDTVNKSAEHAALGRDDFYLMMLAWKLNCPVLSRDRFRDLKSMKAGHLDKFHVYTYSPVKNLPERDYVNPAAAEFARMHQPTTIDYAELLPLPLTA